MVLMGGYALAADITSPSSSQVAPGPAVARISPVLLSMDFDAQNPLPALAASNTQEPKASSVAARANWVADVGTIQEEGTCIRTGALRLQVDASDTAKAWSGALTTGGLAVQNSETNLAKLTLAFDLRVSSARPVVVRIESLDAETRRTGRLEKIIHPAAPKDYQRFAFELSDMKPAGVGVFDPSAPKVSITFEMNSSVAGIGWPTCAGHELCVDNLYYAAPALYVSPSGSDKKNDGSSEEKPLATIGKALERAQPGDIILLMDGVFTKKWALAWFVRAGSPAAWITLKNYPGQRPVLKSIDSNIVKIGQGGSGKISAEPALAYLEVRGLSIRGVADEVAEKYKADIGKSIGTVNGNGLTVDGRSDTHKPHHIRIADNELTQCSGGGISVIHADRVQIEDNHAHENCHWTIFASSGISAYQAFNFDTEVGGHRILIRNNRVHHNYCTQPWVVTGKPSDGNGIIVDDMRNRQNKSANGIYRGGILVQGNISYENGGSGMHSYASDHVDFINNTVANNSTVMDYGQLSVTECGHVRVLNNILASPTNRPMNRVNGKFSDVLLSHNLFWGGNGDTVPGEHAIVADPLFRDAAKGDFRLGKGSPARSSAGIWEIAPTIDLTGHIRSPDRTLDRGAIEE
jgi:hypothetical protein